MTGVSLTLFGNRELRPEKLLNGDIYYAAVSATNLIEKTAGFELRKDHLDLVQFRRKPAGIMAAAQVTARA